MPDTSLWQHSTDTFEGVAGVPIFCQKWIPVQTVCRGSVVIVHGLGEHSGRYRHLVNRLVPEGYAVYTLDHHGFGRSGGRRGHVERFGDYLADIRYLVEMARAEQPGLPLALYGHSLGGLFSLHYALQCPETVDYLVLSAPALSAKFPRYRLALLKLINLIHPTFSVRRPIRPELILRGEEELRLFSSDPLRVPTSTARFASEALAAIRAIWQRAEEIRLPVLMIHGAADRFVEPGPTERFFQQISSSDKTLHLYEGFYHELHNDLGKEKPLDDVAQWLNERMLAPDRSA